MDQETWGDGLYCLQLQPQLNRLLHVAAPHTLLSAREEIFPLGKPVLLHIPGSSFRLRLEVFPDVGTLSFPRHRDLVLKHLDPQVVFFVPAKIQTIRRKPQQSPREGSPCLHTQWPHTALCLLPSWRPSPGTVSWVTMSSRAYLDYKLPQLERKPWSASENSIEDRLLENNHFLTGKAFLLL